MYKLSKRSLKNSQGIYTLLLAILIDGVTHSPYDFGIANDGGVRDAKEQNKAYQVGRTVRITEKTITNCDGYVKLSDHQIEKGGKAVDIYGYVNGKADYRFEVLEAIYLHLKKIAKEKYRVNLKWGGYWSEENRDGPHIYL